MSKFFIVLKDGDVKSALSLFDSSDKATIVKETDQDLWRALHWTAHAGDVTLTEMLLNCGADINAQTVQGFSPLYVAARQHKVDIVTYLLSRGANPNLQDGHHQTALHRACENCYEDVAAALITAENIDLNAQDLMGRTVLHWASAKGLVETTQLLLEHNAKLLKTKGGEDALHWASRSGSEKVVSLLLQKYPTEINIFAKNERDESSVDLTKLDDIRDLLLAHAQSLGYEDDGNKKIQNVAQATTVKRLDQAPKAKKLTIKLKTKDDKK